MFKDPGKVFMKLEYILAKYSLLHSKKEKMLHLYSKFFFFFNPKILYSIDIQTLLVEKQ